MDEERRRLKVGKDDLKLKGTRWRWREGRGRVETETSGGDMDVGVCDEREGSEDKMPGMTQEDEDRMGWRGGYRRRGRAGGVNSGVGGGKDGRRRDSETD